MERKPCFIRHRPPRSIVLPLKRSFPGIPSLRLPLFAGRIGRKFSPTMPDAVATRERGLSNCIVRPRVHRHLTAFFERIKVRESGTSTDIPSSRKRLTRHVRQETMSPTSSITFDARGTRYGWYAKKWQPRPVEDLSWRQNCTPAGVYT